MIENKDLKFRHELKYEISEAQVFLIQNRINHLLQPDKHAGENRAYSIRSLYFDDMYNRCFRENENGTDPREKFRIRIYNHSSQRITLECKRKERGKTLKTSCPLTLEQTKQLMDGIPLPDISHQPPLLRKLTLQMLQRRLRPVVIVEYDRIPYVYPNGNVRITLDRNISSCSTVELFLEERLPTRPVMGKGQQLLEVKYDSHLPDFIYHNLQLQNLRQTAFSKYYLCRKYTR